MHYETKLILVMMNNGFRLLHYNYHFFLKADDAILHSSHSKASYIKIPNFLFLLEVFKVS